MSWERIDCGESDQLHAERDLTVAVGFSDMDGEYGDPEIRREWADKSTGELVVKDIRYLPRLTAAEGIIGETRRPDPKPCEHYRFKAQ